MNNLNSRVGKKYPAVKTTTPHSTIINGGCPNCGGNVSDGTGTGWMSCNDCDTLI